MYSELKALLMALSSGKYDFQNPESVYNSFDELLNLYKDRSSASLGREGATIDDFLKVDFLEECILMRCDSSDKIKEFLDEVNKYDLSYDANLEEELGSSLVYKTDGDFLYDFLSGFSKVEFPKEKLAKLYIKLLVKNPTFFQKSKIFNDPRMNLFFDAEQLAIIEKYKSKFSSLAFSLAERFFECENDEFDYLEEYEEKRMLDFFELNFNTDDPKIIEKREKIVSKIMHDITHASNLQKEFVLRYAAFLKCRENNLPMVNLVFTDESDVLGTHYSKGNIIAVYRELAVNRANTPEKFTNSLNTICHEVEHYLQDRDMYEGNFTLPGYASTVDRFLNDYYSNDYRKNYVYREVEQYARINGMRDAGQFVRKYYDGSLTFLDEMEGKVNSNESEIESLGFHLDDYGYLESRGIVNVRTMVEVFSKNPKLLDAYPILKRFFDSNGALKDLSVLTIDYINCSENERLVYRDICEYLFSEQAFLNNTSLEMLSDDIAKVGLVTMIQDDLTRKKDKIFLICDFLEKLNSGSLRAMDIKKYCYDIIDHYVRQIEYGYSYLLENRNSMNNIYSNNGESILDDVNKFLSEFDESLVKLATSDFSVYGATLARLNNVVNKNYLEEVEIKKNNI